MTVPKYDNDDFNTSILSYSRDPIVPKTMTANKSAGFLCVLGGEQFYKSGQLRLGIAPNLPILSYAHLLH